jgi:hypothetical protein
VPGSTRKLDIQDTRGQHGSDSKVELLDRGGDGDGAVPLQGQAD